MTYTYDNLIADLRDAESVAVLTGAGISAESGVPTFRGKGGIWEEVSIEDVATITAFIRDPVRVWEWFTDLRKVLARCEPNDAHRSLAVLEDRIRDFTLITQNIDNYHQMAGSRNVVELHGNALWDRCWTCGRRYDSKEVDVTVLPPKCECGGTLKPDAVFYEESLSEDVVNKAFDAASRCEIMLTVGTSAMVVPAASLPYVARRSGAKIIEINLEPTGHSSLASLSLFEPATSALTGIVQSLKE